MTTALKRAVFLDRDGVLIKTNLQNGKPFAVHDAAQIQLLAGVEDALASLKNLRFAGVMVTNQPDIGNGVVSAGEVEEINEQIAARLGIDVVMMCAHAQDDGCECRKPKPGMLLEAAETFGFDLESSFMVGDRSSDVAAGKAAGCFSILVGDGYGESFLCEPDAIVADLAAAVGIICTGARPSTY